jgi:hypothetical protein
MIPFWILIAASGIVILICSWGMARALSQPISRVLSLVSILPLTVAVGWIVIADQKLNAHAWFAIILWSLAAVELIYLHLPHLFANRKRWMTLATCAVVSAVLLSVAVHAHWMKFVHPIWMVVMTVLWCASWRWMSTDRRQTPPKETDTSARIVWLVIIGITILWGSWLRFSTLDAFVLQGDEYFHANTAVGYLKTGEYVQWNVLTDEPLPQKPYTRAWMYTWQVAQSVSLFGDDEWAVRLPAFIWGVLMMILAPLIVYRWTRSWGVAFVATAAIAFDPTLIWLSTFSRMYTMVCVTVLLGMAAFWEAVHPQHATRKKPHADRTRWLWYVLSLALIGLSIYIHEVVFLLLGCFYLYLVYAAIHYRSIQWYRTAAGMTTVFLVAGAVVQYLNPLVATHFITLRRIPNEIYLDYPVHQFILPLLAYLCIVCAVLYRHITTAYRPILLWLVAMTAPILIYFTYFGDRYAAKKYAAFMLIGIWVLLGIAWQRWISEYVQRKPVQYIVSALLFTWLFLPLALPGVSESFFFKVNRSDKSYVELDIHDYGSTYALLEAQSLPGDAWILMGTKYQYMNRTDTVLYSTSEQKRMTLDELTVIMEKHPHGWVVLSRPKLGLLPEEYVEYVRTEMRLHPEYKQYNFWVYEWGSAPK